MVVGNNKPSRPHADRERARVSAGGLRIFPLLEVLRMHSAPWPEGRRIPIEPVSVPAEHGDACLTLESNISGSCRGKMGASIAIGMPFWNAISWTSRGIRLDRPVERFGDIVAHPILGGLHHRYTQI
jgi:hypothetical protein